MGLTAGDASMNFVKNFECLHLYFPKADSEIELAIQIIYVGSGPWKHK